MGLQSVEVAAVHSPPGLQNPCLLDLDEAPFSQFTEVLTESVAGDAQVPLNLPSADLHLELHSCSQVNICKGAEIGVQAFGSQAQLGIAEDTGVGRFEAEQICLSLVLLVSFFHLNSPFVPRAQLRFRSPMGR